MASFHNRNRLYFSGATLITEVLFEQLNLADNESQWMLHFLGQYLLCKKFINFVDISNMRQHFNSE